MKYRNRHIEAKLQEYSKFFKTILVVGARQAGKSSILTHAFPSFQSFVFDAVQDQYGIRQDPDLFLNNFPAPIILDEIQHVPELLSAIKRKVDKSDRAGQYFMTGSQNLNALRQVSESLAGRVGVLHLDGMTPAEMSGNGTKPIWLSRYLENPETFFQDFTTVPQKQIAIARHLWRGSFPGLLDAPDSIIPAFMRSYVETYVERDVRVIGNINDLTDFGRFMRLASALSSCETNYSQLGREIGIAPKTARHWLNTLIHSYQWFELPPYHGNTIKRISKKPKGHMRDTGLMCHLMGISSPTALAGHPSFGNIFESWAVCWIARMAEAMQAPPQFYHWRTNGGAEVDLVLERDGFLYPIEIKCKTNLNAHDTRGILAFQETYGKDRVKTGIIIYAGDCIRRVSDCAFCLPWNKL